MKIQINGSEFTKEWLITTPAGQRVLAKAKDAPDRPICTCSTARPSLYIRTRGDMHYLARMPGTAKLHADDCQAHIIPRSVYADSLQASTDILKELWKGAQISDLPENRRYWAGIRSSLYLAAGNIEVDGSSLAARLLIPRPFEQDLAREHEKSNLAFYEKASKDDDGANRYWTLGILKSIEKSKFDYRMQVKHMPRISFWVPEEQTFSLPSPDDGQMLIVMFVGRQVKSGIAVSDIAGILITRDFSTVVVEATQDEADSTDRLIRVANILGLPIDTPRREILDTLVDHFLATQHAKGQRGAR